MEDPRKTVSFVDMAAVSVQPDTNAYKKTEEFTMVTLTEQNTFDFKRVHSTEFSTLTFTTYNTRDKGRKEKKGKSCNKSMWRVEVII